MTGMVHPQDDLSFTVRKVPFDFEDPHCNEQSARVAEELRAMEQLAAQHYGDQAGRHRKRLSNIDLTNPATAHLIRKFPTFQHWLSQIPTAGALHPLYDPDSSHYPTGVAVDDEIREWFRNIADAQGIRSRAAVMRDLLLETVVEGQRTHWLSLACGAAQPVFQTLGQLQCDGRSLPHATLADLDRQALKLADQYAMTHGLSSTTARVNVLDRRGFARIPGPIPGIRSRAGWSASFDAVDAVGILEYLRPEDWIYTYNGVITTKRKQAGAITFLRNAYACVKSGGVLITGNMLDSHPQLAFTMDVVQWPHIQPRSVDEMLEIFQRAGISGHVDVHLPNDGVYAVYAIRKS